MDTDLGKAALADPETYAEVVKHAAYSIRFAESIIGRTIRAESILFRPKIGGGMAQGL